MKLTEMDVVGAVRVDGLRARPTEEAAENAAQMDGLRRWLAVVRQRDVLDLFILHLWLNQEMSVREISTALREGELRASPAFVHARLKRLLKEGRRYV